MEEPEEMGSDITYEYMLPPEEQVSDVQKFYEDTHVFITGGTGFLGNLIIQKLIRSCPGVAKIYLLIRPKNGRTPIERLDDIFKELVFEKMIIDQPDFYEKLQAINGDCEKHNLGLSGTDRKIISDKVHIVFHLATTIFEENIKRAAAVNVRATIDIIALAKTMQNLKAFVHLSTVYSHCPQKEINEQFYDSPITAEKLLEFTNSLDNEQLTNLTPQLLGKWPNSFCFTKAVAESVIQQNGNVLPIAIVRPSMVVSTYKDPLSGWVNNYYGPVGMVIAASVGLMRSFQADPDNITDMVPADYVVNSVIVAAWQVGKEFYNDTNSELINRTTFDDLQVQDNVPIFNYVCSPEKSITWREFMSLVKENGFKFPTQLVLWYYCFTLNPNFYIHKIYTILLHHIPSYIIDTFLYFIGRKPMMVEAYRKLHYFQNFFTYFAMKQWNFKNNNTQALWKKLNRTDQRLFPFTMKDLYWYEYCFTFTTGARVYLLKESMDNLPQAKKRYGRMKIVHYVLVAALWFIAWRVILGFL